jgi:hypothetical protein
MDKLTADEYASLAGNYSYAADEEKNVQSKCFMAGPECLGRSVLRCSAILCCCCVKWS